MTDRSNESCATRSLEVARRALARALLVLSPVTWRLRSAERLKDVANISGVRTNR